MSQLSYLKERLSNLPDFVFTFIQSYYDGESVNTQLAYSIDITTYLVFLQKYRYPDMEKLEDFTPGHLDGVTVDDLINFKAYLREYEIVTQTISGEPMRRTVRNSNYGINRKLSAIRSLYSYLYKTDKIEKNVTEKVTFANISQKIKKPLTAQETVRILDVIFNGERYYAGRDLAEYLNRKQRDIAIFIAYLGTGVRVSELVNLNIYDLCFDTSSFIVTRKGGEQQEIFMPVQVEQELLAYLEQRKKINAADKNALFVSRTGKRLTIGAVERNLKRYCYTAGVMHKDKTRPHALRRTFACRLLEDGVDIKMVADLMGHRNIEVTHKYYAQYASKARKEIMRNFEILSTDITI
ncbi:MAG: Tyrosine recombinase XerS [Firmicutes bacterium ADurb.Bin193]|nr:MAG: Tyrosine recombinase XerS [Firmicutes bacterium ADurb.Bin193]